MYVSHKTLFSDSVVSLVNDNITAMENNESVMICIDSGVTGSFEAVLTVNLTITEGKATEWCYSIHVGAYYDTSPILPHNIILLVTAS